MTLTEKLLLARLCYTHGIEYIDDPVYDRLVFNEVSPLNPYQYSLSEDIPSSLKERLLYIGDSMDIPIRKAVQEESVARSKRLLEVYSTGFDKNKLRSMFAQAVSMQMANDLQVIIQGYLKQIVEMAIQDASIPSIDLHYAYKMDGWNIAVYYDPQLTECISLEDGVEVVTICYAHSRGSDGASYTECTDMLRRITPKLKRTVFRNNEVLQVTGELTMFKSSLPVLNKALGRDYSNVRNTVSAFVKGTVPLEYSNMIQYNAFKVASSSGTLVVASPYESYCWLYSNGFNVPVGNLVTVEKKPTFEETYSALIESFRSTFSAFEAYYTGTVSKDFECDGLTIQPNNYGMSENLKPLAVGNFGYGLLAIKAGAWYKRNYRSEVVQIHFAHSRTNRVPKAIVRPVVSDLGQVLSTVPLLYTQTLIDNDIRIGDTIEFTHHSQQNVEFKQNISALERNKQGVI